MNQILIKFTYTTIQRFGVSKSVIIFSFECILYYYFIQQGLPYFYNLWKNLKHNFK